MSPTPEIPGKDELTTLDWRISSHSTNGGGSSCVEAALMPDGRIVVRHSRAPDGPRTVYTTAEWRAFLAGVRDNEFDFAETA